MSTKDLLSMEETQNDDMVYITDDYLDLTYEFYNTKDKQVEAPCEPNVLSKAHLTIDTSPIGEPDQASAHSPSLRDEKQEENTIVLDLGNGVDQSNGNETLFQQNALESTNNLELKEGKYDCLDKGSEDLLKACVGVDMDLTQNQQSMEYAKGADVQNLLPSQELHGAQELYEALCVFSNQNGQTVSAKQVVRETAQGKGNTKEGLQNIWDSFVDGQSIDEDQDRVEAQRQVPKAIRKQEERAMKIIIVGRSGIGKTTIIKNLFMSYAQDQSFLPCDAQKVSWEDFKNKYQDCVTEVVACDDSNCIKHKFYIQDTPGLNNDEQDKINQVYDFILVQSYAKYLQDMNVGEDYVKELSASPFDLCIYMLPPHIITQFDINSIKQLQKAVNVLPIIARADSLNPEELQQQRERLFQELYNNNEIKLFQFSQEVISKAQIKQEPSQPFAVVTSNQLHPTIPYWPVRNYRWGQCCVFKERDSDLKYIRRLVFEEGYWQIKEASGQQYKIFCKAINQNVFERVQQLAQNNLKGLLLHDNNSLANTLELDNKQSNFNKEIKQEQVQLNLEAKVPLIKELTNIDKFQFKAQQNQQGNPQMQESKTKPALNIGRDFYFSSKECIEGYVLQCPKSKSGYEVYLSLLSQQDKFIVVNVGRHEGESIVQSLQMRANTNKLPQAYDVFANIFNDFNKDGNGYKISGILIDGQKDGLFNCTIVLRLGQQERTYKSKASVGLNVALRLGVPIYISKSLAL